MVFEALWFVCSIFPMNSQKIQLITMSCACLKLSVFFPSSLWQTGIFHLILFSLASCCHPKWHQILVVSALLSLQTFKLFAKAKMLWRAPYFALETCQHQCQYPTKLLNGKTLYLGLAWHTYSYLTLRCFMSTHTRLINVIFMHSARHKTTWVFWHCCFKSLQSSKV